MDGRAAGAAATAVVVEFQGCRWTCQIAYGDSETNFCFTGLSGSPTSHKGAILGVALHGCDEDAVGRRKGDIGSRQTLQATGVPDFLA